MYVRDGRPAFARPCVGIHKSTSAYEFISAYPAMSSMSDSPNLNRFRDRGHEYDMGINNQKDLIKIPKKAKEKNLHDSTKQYLIGW